MATKDMPLKYDNKNLLRVDKFAVLHKSPKQLFVANYSIVKIFIGE
jgi:hypothetical protein